MFKKILTTLIVALALFASSCATTPVRFGDVVGGGGQGGVQGGGGGTGGGSNGPLNALSPQTANYNAQNFKLQNVAAGATANDVLVYAQMNALLNGLSLNGNLLSAIAALGLTPAATFPGSPGSGQLAEVNTASTCSAGATIVLGGSSICLGMWNGSNWIGAGGASGGASAPINALPNQSANYNAQNFQLKNVAPGSVAQDVLTFAQNAAQLTTNQNSSVVASVSTKETCCNVTTDTITKPTNVVNGNVLMMLVGVNSATASVTSTGWTVGPTAAGNGTEVVSLCKIASSEPASYTINFGASIDANEAILNLTGISSCTQDAFQTATANATSLTVPGVATAHTSDLIVSMGYGLFGSNPPWGSVSIGKSQYADSFPFSTNVGTFVQSFGSAPAITYTGAAGVTNSGEAGLTLSLVPATTIQTPPIQINQSGVILQDLKASVNGQINVQAPPYNAQGDGTSDDTNAVQSAIDASEGAPELGGSCLPGAHAPIYMPGPATYFHTKPFHIYCSNTYLYGDTTTHFKQNYFGPSTIVEGFQANNLALVSPLVGSGNGLNVTCSGGGCSPQVILSDILNGTNSSYNLRNRTDFSVGFFIKPTASGIYMVRSDMASPGTGNGAFSLSGTGGFNLVGSVNTTGTSSGNLTQSVLSSGTTYYVELDKSSANSLCYLFLGTPGNTTTVVSAACTGLLGTNTGTGLDPFEVIDLPVGGVALWPDSTQGTLTPTAGTFGPIMFSKVARHTANFTAPNADFVPDANSLLTCNFPSGAPDATTGCTAGLNTQVWLPIRGNSGSAQIFNARVSTLDMCNGTTGINPDGIFAIWTPSSTYDNLSCNVPESVAFNWFNNDFEDTIVKDSVSASGPVAPLAFEFGGAFNEAPIVSNLAADNVSVGFMNQAGGGIMKSEGERITDRGNLIYGYVGLQSQDWIQGFFTDEEAANTIQRGMFYFGGQFAPSTIEGGQSNTRNGAPFIVISGGVGLTVKDHDFDEFGATVAPAEIVDFLADTTHPVTLQNSYIHGSLFAPRSNEPNDPNIVVLDQTIKPATLSWPLPVDVIDNGEGFFCKNCDPPTNPPSPCTSSGLMWGATAYGQNGQWICK